MNIEPVPTRTADMILAGFTVAEIDRVERIRKSIKAGTYETPAKLDVATDGVLDAIDTASDAWKDEQDMRQVPDDLDAAMEHEHQQERRERHELKSIHDID